MGTGSGPGGLNSRIFTNSFAGQSSAMAYPFKPNNYFGFNSKPIYSYNVYHQLANNGAGFGAREGRWARVNNVKISFIPPKTTY
jgi:hypothetical protein